MSMNSCFFQKVSSDFLVRMSTFRYIVGSSNTSLENTEKLCFLRLTKLSGSWTTKCTNHLAPALDNDPHIFTNVPKIPRNSKKANAEIC
jgi:hypothetical protein